MTTDKGDAYEPIDCSFHDRIEAHATEGLIVHIEYREGEEVRELNDRIIDWFVEDGAEFMRTLNGTVVRLDQIVSLDGVVADN